MSAMVQALLMAVAASSSGPTFNGARGVFVCGMNYNGSTYNASAGLDYVAIATTGNTSDFGTTYWVSLSDTGGSSNGTRGVISSGNTFYPSQVNTTWYDYITIASTGNTSNFGTTTQQRRYISGTSHETRGMFASGYTASPVTTIEYVTIASTGNCTSFGAMTSGRWTTGMVSSSTRCVMIGGAGSTTMDYVTIATTGNAASFGTATAATAPSGTGDGSRGIFNVGYTASAQTAAMEYLTIATTGNSASFGNLTSARNGCGSCSNNTRALWAGGSTGGTSYVRTIDYVTISTAANASSFGSLDTVDLARTQLPGFSGA